MLRRREDLTWQILTKRPQRIAAHLPGDWGDGWPHVWLGVSIENRRFVHRADLLREAPAAVQVHQRRAAARPADRDALASAATGDDWTRPNATVRARGANLTSRHRLADQRRRVRRPTSPRARRAPRRRLGAKAARAGVGPRPARRLHRRRRRLPAQAVGRPTPRVRRPRARRSQLGRAPRRDARKRAWRWGMSATRRVRLELDERGARALHAALSEALGARAARRRLPRSRARAARAARWPRAGLA